MLYEREHRLFKRDFSQVDLSGSDPFVMYFLVKESLQLSPGKLAVQVGHGIELYFTYLLECVLQEPMEDAYAEFIYDKWKKDGARKIILKSSDKEFEKAKELFNKKYLVQDAGLTEIDSMTETIMAFAPMKKSDAPKLLKNLRLL